MKIGIIKEGKVPIDKRVPLTPTQARQVKEKYPEIELVVQSSDIRCFSDTDYKSSGIQVVDSLADCDIILGVKEVPIPSLLENKTYLFFSHTIKKQPYNQPLLQEILRKNIRMIDYETLKAPEGNRIIAFGRWAGIVGAYNGILTFGKRNNLFSLRPAHECFDLQDLKTEFSKVELPPIKITLTGGGRVSNGAVEVLEGLKIKRVSPDEFLEKHYSFPVYTQLDMEDYHTRKGDAKFDLQEFFSHPDRYEGDFLKYTKGADVLIAAAYWDPKAPVLFTKEDASAKDFKIKVIADITCDIEGSIPSTVRSSTIDNPLYDYNPSTGLEEAPLSNEQNITVMAVDNLPCELPRDASESFGSQLISNVLPSLLESDDLGIIQKATITENGQLTRFYEYLSDYAYETVRK